MRQYQFGFADLQTMKPVKLNNRSSVTRERLGNEGWERGMGVLKSRIYGVGHSGCITIWVYVPVLPLCVTEKWWRGVLLSLMPQWLGGWIANSEEILQLLINSEGALVIERWIFQFLPILLAFNWVVLCCRRLSCKVGVNWSQTPESPNSEET